ncbi:hypothetical protein ACET3X_000077 [Alternaria dauci]|uniref:Uncharacterized protein n=1 Tax=Alternaria dauci TaxID=48095 RepID=A0ABR3UTW3_9PLEO
MAGQVSTKAIANERAARLKATGQRVYISGLKGHHTLETGVAYHYRGHFIYAFPASNPIEPVPFSTKKGINIVGVVQDQALIYDHKDPDLILEQDIAALQRSCVHEWEFQQAQEESKKQETQKALEAEEAAGHKDTETEPAASSTKDSDADATPKASAQEPLPSQAPSRVPSFTALLVPSQVSSNIACRPSAHHEPVRNKQGSSSSTNIPRIGAVEAPPAQNFPSTAYTPHDRGRYLAYSAPGSRHASVDNTPSVSRSVSPANLHGLSVPGGHGGQGHASIRPIASTSRLNQLLAEEGFRRSMSPVTDVSEDYARRGGHREARNGDHVANLAVSKRWMESDDISAFVETVSRMPSPCRLSSRSRSRPLLGMDSLGPRGDSNSPDKDTDEGLYLHGLGHPDVIRDNASRTQTRQVSPFRAPGHRSAENAAYLRELAMRHYDILPVEPETSSSRSQTPVGHPPTGLFGSPVVATSLHRDAAPAFTFPAPRCTPDTSSFPAFDDDDVSPTSYMGHVDKTPLVTGRSRAGSKSVHTGRPRAASKALNEAYNAANPSSTPRPVFPFSVIPSSEDAGTETDNTATDAQNTTFTARCPLHSESCNGQDVVHEHMTQRARNGAGFKDLFPTIECEDGRVMVDWKKLMNEEMERLKGA